MTMLSVFSTDEPSGVYESSTVAYLIVTPSLIVFPQETEKRVTSAVAKTQAAVINFFILFL